MVKSLEAWEVELRPTLDWVIETVCAYLPDGGVLVDAGANTGLVSQAVLARVPMASAILFEPIPRFADACRARFAGDSRVVVVRSGLSDTVGTSLIHADPANLGWNTLDPTYADLSKEAIPVSLTTLDFLALPSVDVLKVDVESWEGKLLRGARLTIQRCRPVIVMELSYGSSEAMWQEKVAELEWLFSVGYERIDYTLDATRDILLRPIGAEPRHQGVRA